MSRVLLSAMEQLKCNFCTQWFSVIAQFAHLQKYSLNACQKCLANFQYRIVDPTSFQIYDVILLKTGIQLTDKQFQLTNKFESYMKTHRDYQNLNQSAHAMLREEDQRNSDLRAQINMHTRPIKERVSELCRNFLDGIIKSWDSILADLQKGNIQFDKHRQNIIKTLSDRYYNFHKDTEKLLSSERIQQNSNKLKQIANEVKLMNQKNMVNRVKNFIHQFMGLNFPNSSDSYQNTADKQNITPNDKTQKSNIKNIRQKLMNQSRVISSNQLKVPQNKSNIKMTKKQSDKSSKKSSKKSAVKLPLNSSKKSMQKSLQKSIKKSLLNPDNLMASRYKLQKPEHSKSPQSVRLDFEASTQKPTYIIDQYRDKMSKLLKQKNQFNTYMPIQPQKSAPISNKTYGQKCMVQYLVQLKMKTMINDNLCQLINENLSKGNLNCYLKSLQWRNNIGIVRFVKVKIQDADFDTFLNWLSQKISVHILVLSNNLLTQLSVQALCAFCARHPETGLKHVYLGNNYIKPSKVRKTIQKLRSMNINVYV